MASTFFLNDFYQKQLVNVELKSTLERQVHAFLSGECVDLEPLVKEEEKIISNWNELLLLNLLIYLNSSENSYAVHLASRLRSLLHQPWNQNSPYFRTLIALNQFLLKMPVPKVDPFLLEGGALPIEVEEYYPWLALPYAPLHAELGVWITWLAFLTKEETLKHTALQMAKWQLNTLDSNYLPFWGLFVKEANGDLGQQLVWNYLFFHAIAYFLEEPTFECLAQKQGAHLELLIRQQPLVISPLALLIERVMDQKKVMSSPFTLPTTICDPSTALVGYRSAQYSVACTLQGGNTGLGCWNVGDCGVINFGPQHLPLGDCQGFGIEGNYLSNVGARYSSIEFSDQGFQLKGCARLIDQPIYVPNPYFQLGKFRGIWLETEQELKDNQLNVSTNFLGFDGWENVAFSFFIKADRCQVNSNLTLLPCTFERYQGAPKPLLMGNDTSSFYLKALHNWGSMQVIPLGGQNSFWGASFLVAYLLDTNQRQYRWQLSLA